MCSVNMFPLLMKFPRQRATSWMNPAPVLVVEGAPRTVLREAQATGMNVQVACSIDGYLAWISDPLPGSRHDNHCLGESSVLTTLDPRNWLGDKGYVGNNMITPFKKPPGSELLDWQKEFNTEVNKIRYVIEQVIANFKTWRIVHTGSRRPLGDIPQTTQPSSSCTSQPPE